MPNSGLVFTGQSGCLLPMLIMFNLFFGKFIFNSTRLWLGIEGILVLLFIIKIHAFARKISEQLQPEDHRPVTGRQGYKPEGRGRGEVVDVEGEIVEEKHKLG